MAACMEEHSPSEQIVLPLADDDSKQYLKSIEGFVLLGISRYSGYTEIVRMVDILIKKLISDPKEVDDVISLLEELSTSGRCMNQDAIFLCLVICYVHAGQLGKAEVGKRINTFCRIPTHLFIFLKILREYLDRGATANTPCNTVEFYEAILDSRGSSTPHQAKQGKNSKAQKSEEAIDSDKSKTKSESTSKSFISKHKFISHWYSDPKKKASDLLLLLTKYQSREGWDHKTLIRYSHPKFQKDDEELQEKNVVMQYYLDGFKKIKDDYDRCLENLTGRSESICRVYKFIQVLEEVKTVMKQKEGRKGEHAERICNLIHQNTRVLLDPLRDHVSYQYSTASDRSMSSNPSDTSIFDMTSIDDQGKASRLHITLEHLPNSMYNEKDVLKELFRDMPMSAMLKHMSHMSCMGLFDEEEKEETGEVENENNEEEKDSFYEEKEKTSVYVVREAFTNPHRIFPFIHPFQILRTLQAYAKGESGYGTKKKSFEVNQTISSLLQDAFFLSLKRKRRHITFEHCIVCIDDSQPMHQQGFLGVASLSAAVASTALATAIGKMGNNISVYLCNSTPEKMDVSNLMDGMNRVGADSVNKEKSSLASPIKDAIEAGTKLSAVIVFTKSTEEYRFGGDVYKTFTELRQKMGYGVDEGTKLIIVSMEANWKVLNDLSDTNVNVVCGGDADVLVSLNCCIERKSLNEKQKLVFEGYE